MMNKWSESSAKAFVEKHGAEHGDAVALLSYATRLVGSEPDMALHGGGNTSIKTSVQTRTGTARALFVKASGVALDSITPSGFVCLDLAALRKLASCRALDDEAMADEFRTHCVRPSDAVASVETLMHAFVDKPCIIHTHPSAVLALTNRENGGALARDVLGKTCAVLPHVNAGFELGKAVAAAVKKNKALRSVVISHHGLVSWGAGPKQAYDAAVEAVAKAEEYLAKSRVRAVAPAADGAVGAARKRYSKLAPMLRGLLSPASGNPDSPHAFVTLAPVINADVLGLLSRREAKRLCVSPPLTPDYCVRTKSFPLWIDVPDSDDLDAVRAAVASAVASFAQRYGAYAKKYAEPRFAASGFDFLPRVVLMPGLGAVCAGRDAASAAVAADITAQALLVKKAVYETGGAYKGLSEAHLAAMEFRPFQTAKVARDGTLSLRGAAALVTGSAGAIGSGICEALLENGCNLVVTDLGGERLDSMVARLKETYGGRVTGAPLDVTDSASVAAAFEKAVEAFGGLDIVIANAGVAHVSPLAGMDLEAFRKIARINVDGTLTVLSEAGRLFKLQNIGGDIVLVSTKNVFAPGAKFGAYSATKAAAHQLARIASIEFAEMGVRVNMVSPDAVFSHGATKSGLWQQVGPDRMKARGLDEKGLEEYYRGRNLLKAKVTAKHVARAVLFFVTRQTPTTGATIPVDGGLPDATPR
jgi:rhamnose utilization protein RhaD (predicted bifunctional aldolase and dehydrogenase)/NAD(P)-dependent dehydrogenase (short-subunit alcohol dehydrogenase family)